MATRPYLSALGALAFLSFLGLATAQSTTSLYDQALAEVQAGHFDASLPLLERLVRESPQDLRARNLFGIALSAAGRREDANRQFVQVLSKNPSFLPALKNLAFNELELGHTAEARRRYEEAIKLAPKDPVVQLGWGQIEFAAKHFDRAVEHYESSGDLYLREPAALVHYAASCVESKQPAKALRALAQLPHESAPTAHFEAGLLYARLDQFKDAAREFELARSEWTDRYQVDFNLTLAYLKSGNSTAAIQTAETLISVQPTAEIYGVLARAYESAGRTKDAYEALRSATRLDPNDEAPYLDLIALCAEHENYDLSMEIADIGVRKLPQSDRIRTQRGIVLALMGRFEDAERDFNRSAELAPQTSLGAVAKALILIRTNRIPAAVEDLRRRKSRNDGDYLVNWYLAEALTRLGDSDVDDEAVAALQRSVELNPNVAQSRILLGKLLLARGDTDGATSHLEKALELDPDSVAATYQLALAYRKKGDSRRAAELFAKVSKAKSEPSDQLTRSGLLRIVREASH